MVGILTYSVKKLHTAADVLLWRNKKISASVLASATAVWVLFEWLNYHFLTLVCLFLVLGMLAQFMWRNVSGLLNKYASFSLF
ncbi:Reticulon-like protein B8 [Linum perenne]